MLDLAAIIRERGFLIADGAWGTELAKAGLQAGDCPEAWNETNPDAVFAVARGYVEAGSDIILTNTFGGSQLKLAKCGLEDKTKLLNTLGVEISKRAAQDKALVFASLGPTGEFMEPYGTFSEEDFVTVFAEQIAVIAQAEADGILIETMTALEEVFAAVKAARKISDLPVIASMTYDIGPAGFATMMGVKPEAAAGALIDVESVGANCGSGIDNMIELARHLRPATRKPLWIKPNAGLPQLVDGRTVYGETAEQMVSRLPELIEAGANIVGGCCGTTPEHIRLIAEKRPELAKRAGELFEKSVDT